MIVGEKEEAIPSSTSLVHESFQLVFPLNNGGYES
jgi:hypothetical protein